MTVLGLGQSSETTFDSVNGSRALTTGAARPSDINLYTLQLSSHIGQVRSTLVRRLKCVRWGIPSTQ